jgi:hypothetical protein
MASGQAESTVTMTAASSEGAAAHELALDQSHYEMAFTTGAVAKNVDSAIDSNAGPIITAYAWHGLRHILGGYDHLLFPGALVLAAATLSELVNHCDPAATSSTKSICTEDAITPPRPMASRKAGLFMTASAACRESKAFTTISRFGSSVPRQTR